MDNEKLLNLLDRFIHCIETIENDRITIAVPNTNTQAQIRIIKENIQTLRNENR